MYAFEQMKFVGGICGGRDVMWLTVHAGLPYKRTVGPQGAEHHRYASGLDSLLLFSSSTLLGEPSLLPPGLLPGEDFLARLTWK